MNIKLTYLAACLFCLVYSVQCQNPSPHDWFNWERILYADTNRSQANESTTSAPVGSNQPLARSKRTYQTYHKSYGLKYCKAIVSTATDQWCNDNCRQGYCPATHCLCSNSFNYGYESKGYNNYGTGKHSYGSGYKKAYGSGYNTISGSGYESGYGSGYGSGYESGYGSKYGSNKYGLIHNFGKNVYDGGNYGSTHYSKYNTDTKHKNSYQHTYQESTPILQQKTEDY